VFKTSNLVQVPHATQCEIEYRVKLSPTPLSERANQTNMNYRMQSVKGGLLLHSESETEYGELVHYNMTQFFSLRHQPVPEYE